jgi:hypothetical protein
MSATRPRAPLMVSLCLLGLSAAGCQRKPTQSDVDDLLRRSFAQTLPLTSRTICGTAARGIKLTTVTATLPEGDRRDGTAHVKGTADGGDGRTCEADVDYTLDWVATRSTKVKRSGGKTKKQTTHGGFWRLKALSIRAVQTAGVGLDKARVAADTIEDTEEE